MGVGLRGEQVDVGRQDVRVANRTILGSIMVSHNELTEKLLKKYKKKSKVLI
jgi:hypothetical protein